MMKQMDFFRPTLNLNEVALAGKIVSIIVSIRNRVKYMKNWQGSIHGEKCQAGKV